MTDVFDVSNGAAYAVLFTILIFFTILASFSSGIGASYLPVSIQKLIVAKGGKDGEVTVSKRFVAESNSEEALKSGFLATDFFL